MSTTPHVTILSGSLSQSSRCAEIAALCAHRLAEQGLSHTLFDGTKLDLPFYGAHDRSHVGVQRLVDDLRRSSAVVLVSPCYHGTISGLLKNALDYTSELHGDEHPFLDGRVVGCVAISGGVEGAGMTLTALRGIVHALRAWPTPYGVALVYPTSSQVGPIITPQIRQKVDLMVSQILDFVGASRSGEEGELLAS